MRSILLASATTVTLIDRRLSNASIDLLGFLFGCKQHGTRTMDEKRAQIEIAALGNASQPNFAARAALSGHQAHKRGKFAASTEPAWPSFATSAVALSSPMPGSSAIAQQGRQQRFEFRRTIADLLQAGLPSAFEHHAKLIQQAPQLVDLGRS